MEFLKLSDFVKLILSKVREFSVSSIHFDLYTPNSKKVVFWIVALRIVAYPDRKAPWM